MNLRINIPIHFNTLEVSELTKDALISELYDYYLAGVNLTECTTDLPKNIIDLTNFHSKLGDILNGNNLEIYNAEEDDVKEALEQCVSDEWDVLNELCNEHDEDFAAACLEYTNGGDLSDAEGKYIGQWNSDKDYVMDTFMDTNEIPQHLKNYLDWDQIERDYMMDITEINGYYFNA